MHGALTADMASEQPNIWHDAAYAQRFVTRLSAYYQIQVMLLDPEGVLVASSEVDDGDQVGQRLELPNLDQVLAGENLVRVNYTRNLEIDIAEVLLPVIGPDQEIVGVVRVSNQLSDLSEQVARLHYLIIVVLSAALLFSMILGLVLAIRLGRPLKQVTEGINRVVTGGRWITLPEEGPEEMRLVMVAFNALIELLRAL